MKTQGLAIRNLLSGTGTESPKLPPSLTFPGHHSAPGQRNQGLSLRYKPVFHYTWALTYFLWSCVLGTTQLHNLNGRI
ncbi:hypothetical protein I79_019977 [Cricetulus griseus]|uniref:Uncharacterized protein n=1 Tax=Cricetulus griseus TaxID=10029 RepID=G3I8U5_CRIGR|nr:hypothetical protein I79_019977 [Cricetulus griseus]